MAKMGISTLQSYCGAQIFEAIGLNRDLVDRYFTGTASRVAGIGLDVIAEEVARRHAAPSRPRRSAPAELDWGGEYQWRRDGEHHMVNPDMIAKLQHATRAGSTAIFRTTRGSWTTRAASLATLRGLIELKPAATPIPLDEVEPVESILKRFATGRHVLRLHQPGGPRDPGHRHEPHRRQVQHRRGRRGRGPLPARSQRRLAPQRGQAGRLRPLRRHQRVPGQRRRSADQDGPGRQARRGRPAARPQGLSVDRQGALRDAGRGAHLAAPPSRHLLDRGHQAAHPRSEERQPAGARAREARGRGRRGHGGGRAWPRPSRTSCSSPATTAAPGASPLTVDQARRRPLGARPGRDPAGARAQQAARPHRRPGRRPAEDRPRRRHRRPARRRGVRLLDGAAGGAGLHHDARLPPQHLPGRASPPRIPSCASASPAGRSTSCNFFRFLAEEVREHMADARLPDDGRDDRPGGPARLQARPRALEGPRARPVRRSSTSPTCRRRWPGAACPAQDHGLERSLDTTTLIPACREAIEHGKPVELRAAHPQRQPHRGHHARLRDHAALGRRGSARRHHPASLHGLGRPELRRLRAARHHLHPRGRRQRLLGQGALGRQADRLPAAGRRPSCPRRTSSSATSPSTAPPAARPTCAAWPASASPSATAASTPSSRASATTAAST